MKKKMRRLLILGMTFFVLAGAWYRLNNSNPLPRKDLFIETCVFAFDTTPEYCHDFMKDYGKFMNEQAKN